MPRKAIGASRSIRFFGSSDTFAACSTHSGSRELYLSLHRPRTGKTRTNRTCAGAAIADAAFDRRCGNSIDATHQGRQIGHWQVLDSIHVWNVLYAI